MSRYGIKVGEMFVENVGEDFVEFTTKSPDYGLADNLRWVQKQQNYLEKLGYGRGTVYQKITTKHYRTVTLEEVQKDLLKAGRHYILVNENGITVSDHNDYGEVSLSIQRAMEITRHYEVERILDDMERLGITGYEIKEVTVEKEIQFLTEEDVM